MDAVNRRLQAALIVAAITVPGCAEAQDRVAVTFGAGRIAIVAAVRMEANN